MKDISEFLGTFFLYFVIAYVIICILMSVGCNPTPPVALKYPDNSASFQAYLHSGEHQRVLHMRRQAYGNCLVEMLAGEPVNCGERSED